MGRCEGDADGEERGVGPMNGRAGLLVEDVLTEGLAKLAWGAVRDTLGAVAVGTLLLGVETTLGERVEIGVAGFANDAFGALVCGLGIFERSIERGVEGATGEL